MVQQNKSVNMKIKNEATSGGEGYFTLIHRLLNMIWKLEGANKSSWHLLFLLIFFFSVSESSKKIEQNLLFLQSKRGRVVPAIG